LEKRRRKTLVTELTDLLSWVLLFDSDLTSLRLCCWATSQRWDATDDSAAERLLIAVEAGELFRRFEAYISGDLRAGQNLRAQHCLPDQLDSRLREYDTDVGERGWMV